MSVVFKIVPMAVILVVFALFAFCEEGEGRAGLDVAKVLQQAAKGEPVRLVVFGGSITLGGEGWIRDWLIKTFPKSTIFIQNAGLGGTGSDLGVFRLDRDVMEFQPNLVFIEFSVNDSGLTDAEAIRNIESMIVRLRHLAQPPGIVLLIAGQQSKGLAKERIQRLAAHYKLLVIDLDEALHRHVENKKLAWNDLMQDAVHPNPRGHAFYGEVIARYLAPLLNVSIPKGADGALPLPLSKSPLLLESSLMPLTSAAGWTSEDTLPGREFRSFPGLISATEPGTTISVPFQGTQVALFFPLQPQYGSFYASIDGQLPQQILENSYEGYGFQMLAEDLAPGPHVLTLTIPPLEPDTKAFKVNGPVKLGSVLAAGYPASKTAALAPASGPYTPEILGKLRFQAVPLAAIGWIGPFTDGKERNRADVTEIFAPEALALRGEFPREGANLFGTNLRWAMFPAESAPAVDLAALAAGSRNYVFYLATRVISPSAGTALLRLSIKGRRQIWINGSLVSQAKPDSDSDLLLIVPVELQAGTNTLLWKVGSTKGASTFSASMALPSGQPLEFQSPLIP